jgi:peptidoglycan-N-acetylglucosamine deacetylase
MALTFDAEHPDRPHAAGGMERVLDRLAETGIAATFFVQGRWAEAYPAIARRMAEAGHLIGNHSHYHARMPLLSATGLATDVTDAETAIVEATGVSPRPWFRCPFGAGTDDPAVLAALGRLGYREIRWHVEGPDWPPDTDGIAMAEAMAEAAIANGDGAVILLHPWSDGCRDGLPPLMDRLLTAGATFVRIDELDAVPGLP